MAAERLTLLAAAWLCAAPAAALSPTAEKALDEGLHRLYGLDYPGARAAFRGLIERQPDDPFGYLFESGAIWWEASQQYGLFKDTPTLQGLFERDVELGIEKAQAWITSGDLERQVDGHFAAGMLLGMKGQWHVMRRQYLRAYLDGKHALRHLKKCLKLDPGYDDAYLGLGVFDYQAAHFSGIVRLGGWFGGMRGDEKRGLAQIHRAAERSKHSRRQAAEFLTNLYIVDKRDWAAALPLVERLRAEFPESVYFLAVEAMLRWRLGDTQRSLALGPEAFSRVKTDPGWLNAKLLTLVCGLSGPTCLDGDQAAWLRAWLGAALNAAPAGADPGYLTLLHLYRGYMADALGRTDEATAEYERVLKRPDFGDSHARAKACLETGCPAKELLAYLREQSKNQSGR